MIRSDGFSVDCLFYKESKDTAGGSDSLDLQLEHFNYEEIQASYSPTFIDPGRKSVFTAVSGLDTNAHTIMRCSTKEYYHYTGSTKFSAAQKRLKKTNHIEEIESNIPTTKTSSADGFRRYIEYTFQHLNRLFDFYDHNSAKSRFFLYQGRQRAPEIMVNMLINGGPKYNKACRKLKNRKKKRGQRKKQDVTEEARTASANDPNANNRKLK